MARNGTPASAGGRVRYVEGLRGLAALQVMLLHQFTAFLPAATERTPALAHAAWENILAAPPLRFLYDGHSAVYLFFLISGAVLTGSFARGLGHPLAQAAKRYLRLVIPVAAAAAIALLLLALFPDEHQRAAAITGSVWFASDSTGAITLGHLVREIGLDSLLLGYRSSTLFPWLAPLLPDMAHSLDAPFWSLHVEFYGSLLVLLLVELGARSRLAHAALVAALAILLGTHPIFLLVLGHLSAKALGRARPWAALPGAALVVFGIAMSATKDWSWVEALRLLLLRPALAGAPDLFQFQSQLGAFLVFAGVLISAPLQRALACKPLAALGRLSFSLYLLHFPILFTLTSAIFLQLYGVFHYGLSAILAMAIGAALTLVAAIAFEQAIDRTAISLSRRLANEKPRRGGLGGASLSSST